MSSATAFKKFCENYLNLLLIHFIFISLQKPIIATVLMCVMITFGNTQYNNNNNQQQRVPYPIAYNLHKQATPSDINDLNGELVLRAMKDVSTTITQVQRLLATDPRLPRLTRGEIEELFEKVTNEEYTKSLQQGDHNRAKHMRALMLVLPFNANNNDTLQDLYEKAPVTKLVDGAPKPKPQPIQFEPPSGKVKIVSLKPSDMAAFRPPKKVAHQPVMRTPLAQPLIRVPITTTLRATTTRQTTLRPTITSTTTTTATEIPKKYRDVDITARHPLLPSRKATPFTLVHPSGGGGDNVKNMLASIGLFQESQNNVVPFKKLPYSDIPRMPPAPSTTVKPVPELTPELKTLLQSFGFLQDQQTTSTASPFVAFDLPQDAMMPQQQVQQSFEEPLDQSYEPFYPSPLSHTFEPKNAHFSPNFAANDFTAFKPLQFQENAREAVDTDLENLLRNYGLIDNRRAKKSMHTSGEDATTLQPPSQSSSTTTTTTQKPTTTPMVSIPTVSVDMLPNDMIKVLDTIGISTRKANHNYDAKKPRKIGSSKAHGFRPASYSKSDAEDFEKLNQLLETIKQLDRLNKNLTDSDISKLDIKNYNFSASLLDQGPDPLDNIELIHYKNEIKRQEKPVRLSLFDIEDNNTSSSPSSSTETPVTIVTPSSETAEELTATTTEEPSNDSLSSTTEEPASSTETTSSSSLDESRASDLDDSFASGSDPTDEEPLPEPRRNGFYFLTDINKFLEVGEEPDKVEVKYQRKFGDPSRWFSVSVP